MRLITAAPGLLAVLPASAAAERNNLLVVLTDQQRYDAMGMVMKERGYQEESRVRTPNLDRIAQGGAYFRNAYTHCAVCVPARASLLTGATVQNHGIRSNRLAKDEKIIGTDAEHKLPRRPTYDRILVEEHGYVAEYYGKWHVPNSMGVGVYSNDVRRGDQTSSWFGKYNPDGTKHYAWGMTYWYRRWLEDQPNALNATSPLESGDQVNTYSRYWYRPDPLDSRFGMETGADKGADGSDVKQPDQHGMNRLEDGLSNTAQQAGEVVEALDRLARSGEPFSLHLSLHSPHAPMIPTPGYYNMYDPADMIPPESLGDDRENSAYAFMGRKYEDKGYDNPGKVRRWIANYFALVTEIDEWVGRLLDKLDELGITERTLLAFSSDHGEMLGSHGLREKNNFYEESSHVPLLLYMPGTIPAGIAIDDLVSHLDLHSTFLDYAVGRDDYLSDGRSLRGNIEGVDAEDDFVVTMWNYTDVRPAFLIRKGDFKLIMSSDAGRDNIDMLFNLEDDPSEMNNLLGKNGATASDATIVKAEHLRAMLVKYLQDSGHPAAGEIQSRQTWRQTTFWAESSLTFRDTLPDGTRVEYLYIGSPPGAKVTVRVEGDAADRYGLQMESQHGGNGKGFSVVAVRYQGSVGDEPLLANLAIELEGGEKKQVWLIPPLNVKTLPSAIDFVLDIPQDVPDGCKLFHGLPFTADAMQFCDFDDSDIHHRGHDECGEGPVDGLLADGSTGCDSHCHIAFTAAGEYVSYHFQTESRAERVTIRAKVASNTDKRKRIRLELKGEDLESEAMYAPGKGYKVFEEVTWEVSDLREGPHRLHVIFVDGNTNFCAVTVENSASADSHTHSFSQGSGMQ